jgi:hypothetical protein
MSGAYKLVGKRLQDTDDAPEDIEVQLKMFETSILIQLKGFALNGTLVFDADLSKESLLSIGDVLYSAVEDYLKDDQMKN